jgi:hypothetical protein
MDDGAKEFGVLRHYKSGEGELSLSHQLGLIRQFMVGKMHVKRLQIRVIKELAHQIRRA